MASGLTRDYLVHHRVCPIALTADGTLVVSAAPTALLDDAVDDLALVYDRPVIVREESEAEIDRSIERLSAAHPDEGMGFALERSSIDAADDGTTDVRDLANQPPVVRYVNLLVHEAYEAGASDVHLEATKHGLVARVRLDGVLVPTQEPAPALAHAVVSRIKLLAELDIAERRRPQDGRIRVRLDARELDLRVSTVPTLFGESVVLRLLDRGGRPVTLPELGMPARILQTTTQLAQRPHGLLLVTGPTGSGKTTTLYAALQLRSAVAEKIITVEDPVEYELAGITQVPVHRQAGVTFAAALRSILRQDPDVVMLGEMRDPETAEVAVQAAMTGHLVLSTLHTNDSISAVPRLIDLGVPPYLIAATLDGILAQRLVRVICERCREPDEPAPLLVSTLRRVAAAKSITTDDDPNETTPAAFARGGGCASCRQTGYRGRVGLFELTPVSDELKDAIARGAPRADLRVLAARVGMRPLAADGWNKARAGITTVEEVLRVVQH